jgi:hypothetical protein
MGGYFGFFSTYLANNQMLKVDKLNCSTCFLKPGVSNSNWFYNKKAFAGRNIQVKPSKSAELGQTYSIGIF